MAVLSSNLNSEIRAALSMSSLELSLNNGKVQEAETKYRAKLRKIIDGKKSVVGYAFAINGELNSAEVYASNDLFGKLWDKMLRASAVEAVSVLDAKEGKTKPVTSEAVQAFLTVEKKGRGQDVNARVKLVTVDGDKVVFSETRDEEANGAWLHRSYFAK